ncbi:MAG TPA: cupredoxin domain-containing protein [Candidatus Limnocylindrales bacterium]|jgi:plastocyanin
MRRFLFGSLTLFAALALAACGGGSSAAPSSQAASSPPAASEPASSGPAASEPASSAPAAAGCAESADTATVETTIKGFAFAQPLTAKVGDVVSWSNEDSAPHSVVLDDGQCQTQQIAAGSSSALVFNEAGSFAFHCGVHPNMTATIEVTE